jgi:hypothetical protein
MKRLGSVFGLVLLGSMVAGCGDSGVEVGVPKEIPATTQSQEFRDMMKTAGPNMTKGQRRGGAPKPKPKVSPAPEATKESP